MRAGENGLRLVSAQSVAVKAQKAVLVTVKVETIAKVSCFTNRPLLSLLSASV